MYDKNRDSRKILVCICMRSRCVHIVSDNELAITRTATAKTARASGCLLRMIAAEVSTVATRPTTMNAMKNPKKAEITASVAKYHSFL